MKKIFYSVLVLSMAFIWSCNRIEDELSVRPENSPPEAKSGDIIPGQYIVRLKDGATSIRMAKMAYSDAQLAMRNEVQKILQASVISQRDPLFVYTSSIEGFAVQLSDDEVKSLKKNDAVSGISPDKVIALGKPGSQPSSYPSPQVVPWGVLRVHGVLQYTGTRKVWIIDSGVDLDHQDLNVSQDMGATFVNNSSSPDDNYGHGTACAGVIGAKNDAYGVVGVAPGALIVPVKVLGSSGEGTVSAVLAGVDYVSTHAEPYDVVNMCIGTSVSTDLDAAVIAMASIVNKTLYVTVPAGNDAVDASNVSPARANHDNIFTVSSYSEIDAYCSQDGFPLSYFSNYGIDVDCAGPGLKIITTYKGNGLIRWTGTSMAAAHVAGVLLVTGSPLITDGLIINDKGDGVADPIAVTGPESNWHLVPVVSTGDFSAVTSTTAYTGAIITSDGGTEIRESGVCWNTTGEPTIDADPKAENNYYKTSLMTGLFPGSTYHVRAYATNLTGTVYGDERIFETLPQDIGIHFNPGLTYGTLTDNEGNSYKTIKIGTKTWMAQNLRSTLLNDGTTIATTEDNLVWQGFTGAAYCWYLNNRDKYGETYGALYNWYAVNTGKLCPTGWHVPSKDEYSALIKSLGGENVAGGKLKEAGTDHWMSPNTGATNSSGFTLIPGGMRYPDPECYWPDANSAFDYIHLEGRCWTSTNEPRVEKSAYQLQGVGSPMFMVTKVGLGARDWRNGYSVRCVKD